jgi:hypothetical protein
MPLFGSPSIDKLKKQRDIPGLVKALEYKRDSLKNDHSYPGVDFPL